MIVSNKDNKKIILDKISGKEYPFTVNKNSTYTLASKDYEVSIERTNDGFIFLIVNGNKHEVEILSRSQNEYEILLNGVSYHFSVESPFSLERRKMLDAREGETSIILLKAPMPGKILEVLVKAGDIVKAGDTLLILEAMKMQNAILSSIKGTVKKVYAKANDTTSKSDLLIEIQKD